MDMAGGSIGREVPFGFSIEGGARYHAPLLMLGYRFSQLLV
jgi:hypothetical protein